MNIDWELIARENKDRLDAARAETERWQQTCANLEKDYVAALACAKAFHDVAVKERNALRQEVAHLTVEVERLKAVLSFR